MRRRLIIAILAAACGCFAPIIVEAAEDSRAVLFDALSGLPAEDDNGNLKLPLLYVDLAAIEWALHLEPQASLGSEDKAGVLAYLDRYRTLDDLVVQITELRINGAWLWREFFGFTLPQLRIFAQAGLAYQPVYLLRGREDALRVPDIAERLIAQGARLEAGTAGVVALATQPTPILWKFPVAAGRTKPLWIRMQEQRLVVTAEAHIGNWLLDPKPIPSFASLRWFRETLELLTVDPDWRIAQMVLTSRTGGMLAKSKPTPTTALALVVLLLNNGEARLVFMLPEASLADAQLAMAIVVARLSDYPGSKMMLGGNDSVAAQLLATLSSRVEPIAENFLAVVEARFPLPVPSSGTQAIGAPYDLVNKILGAAWRRQLDLVRRVNQ